MSNSSQDTSTETSDQTDLELYKIAYDRLSFQDTYLFRFTAVFLAVHGALALLAKSALFESGEVNRPVLLTASAIGFYLSLLWMMWTHHNDYWHSVWKGVLISLEETHLNTSAKVFSADHRAIALKGKRLGDFITRGHRLAVLIPFGISVMWFIGIAYGLLS